MLYNSRYYLSIFNIDFIVDNPYLVSLLEKERKA